MSDYRPTIADFRPTKTQQLSCREAGEFDKKTAHPPTGWATVCADRAKRGISRKARIRGGQS